MGYNMSGGRYAATTPVTLHASAARTTTANGSAIELGDKGTLRLLLSVTANSGTDETLDVAVETSYDGTTWRSVAAFAQKTGTGTERKSFSGMDRFARVAWTIGGTDTPSFTFAVTGEAC